MGDAKSREEEAAKSAAQQAAVNGRTQKLTVQQGLVIKYLQLCIHMLAGAAHQLTNDWQQPEAGAELMKSCAFLQKHVERVLGKGSQLVIASPADIPRPPPGLLQR